MKKLFVIVMFAVIGSILNTVPKVEALSCAAPHPTIQEMERSSVVFKGRVIETKTEGLTVFQVEKAWKGIEDPVFEIYDTGWDAYTIGADYLVFGSQREGKLRTNLCGGTGVWDAAQEAAMREIKLEPTVFKKESSQVSVESSNRFYQQSWIVLTVSLLFLIILIFSVVWIVEKRRNF
ncbi:hypothetical protein [Paenibacillus qinlingensis]|uniref:Ion transporter superfamily protein YfcC n=1 Tax=Paenibacillus qinlingensis TaxID=1837343 RepID=A0ABU1P698_9BACL|nr:hypothetical protein [Paenibacillus qinlingensis]MDR6555079.1 putative ion transporter superfamily protein YfcC [Paenibacillus qinlingensis]